MIEFAGINPETGAPQFYTNDVDENGNYIKDITEEINKAHAIVLDKHAEPNAIGGLSNTLRYKWFDLNFMFSYQLVVTLMTTGHRKPNMVVMTWKLISRPTIKIVGRSREMLQI